MNRNTILPVQKPSSSKVEEIGRKQLVCFYEPLAFLKALTSISLIQERLRLPDRRPEPQTEEDIFCRYLDKLASMCDRKKGGSTVTAVAVLEAEDSFIYVLGCNQVSEDELKKTAMFVAAILRNVDQVNQLRSGSGLGSEPEPAEELLGRIRNDIRYRIVLFNRPRIQKYVTYLLGDLQACIQSCAKLNRHEDVSEVARGLKQLREGIKHINEAFDTVDDEEYATSCFRCFADIQSFGTANIRNFIEQRANEGRLHDYNSMVCWSELRHHLTRLTEYDDAVETFIDIGQRWPELFQEFKICPILSSNPNTNPLQKKSQSASKIIGHMSDDRKKVAHFRNLAKDLQREPYDLDKRIKAQIEKLSFKPIIHCEVLVLDWILRDSAHLPEFFNGIRYIGTSKRACKLCDYFFQAHPSRVKTRPSHGNVYPNWAFPTVFESDGEEALEIRQKMLNSLKESVRNDTFRVLES